VESFRTKRIVGAGNLVSRHAAMEAGELEPDYLFFGRPHGDTHDRPHPKALDLAEWWSDLMQLPAVVMAGRSLDGVAEAAATGAAFVALHDAVWLHAGGPGEAVRLAEAALGRSGRRAA
jgi:thiamine-phosphate pyrophosphorylase